MIPVLLALLSCTSKPGGGDGLAGDGGGAATDGGLAGTGGGDDTGTSGGICGDGMVDPDEDCEPGEALDTGGACGCQADCHFAPVGSACEDGDDCSLNDACDGFGACVAGAPPDCDDADACTTDHCEAGTCLHDSWSGSPADLFDMPFLTDPSTLDVEVVGTSTVWEGLTPITVEELRYTSYAYTDCTLEPVRLEAYLAIPPGASASSPVPGLAVAHGLGGYATAGAASTPAAQLGVVAIAWSGPGQGASEGVGSTSDHLFDTVPFPGNSWFWEHAVAAIRGITLLTTLDQVDPDRLAMTGYSGGALVSYLVNGVDDRIDAIVPVSATGHLDLAIAATPTPGWEYDLLQAMDPPRDESSPEWAAFETWLDPKNYLATAHGLPLIVDGAQDEFFPLPSMIATINDLQAVLPDARLLAIPNWDHGWYAYFNGDAAQAEAEASLAFWMGGRLGTDAGLSAVPPQPAFAGIVPWTCLYDGWYPYACTAVLLDTGTTGYDVASARFHWSSDSATAFQSWNLEDQGGGLWGAEVGTLDWNSWNDSNLVYFGEVTYQDGWLGPEVTVTTIPHVYDGFSPVILPSEL